VQLDITAEDAGLAIARAVGAPIDILIHNAGITRDRMLANMDAARWDSVLAVNIESQLRMNAQLTEAGAWGEAPRIVSLASTSGIAGNRGQTNYAASKAGVIGMVAASAAELSAQNGTINAVAPGFIETEMTAKMPALTRELARRVSSLQQGGLPVDVAETIAFLASDAAGGISGDTVRVCGQNMVGA
jgi:3-oxoacyl-[acyl-carrier protein] reductase